jgi:hypothetical protein
MMDYLEGFLIGSIWSDTDYRTRRHYHAHVFLAALMGAAFTFFLFFPDKMSKWVVVPQPLSLVFLIFLILATPIISSIYYRVPFYVRPFLLLLYIMKYVLLFYTLVHFFFPLVTVDRANFSDLLFARIDDRMTRRLIDSAIPAKFLRRSPVCLSELLDYCRRSSRRTYSDCRTACRHLSSERYTLCP